MGDRIKRNNKKSIGSQIEQENQSHRIPNDLIFDILPRLPVKSLVRFKCVSKSWCSFISQLKRGKHKLLFSTRRRYLILPPDQRIHSVDIEAPNIVSQPLCTLFPLGSLFEIIGCCNGLICLLMKSEDAVELSNPLTRTYRSILLSKDKPAFYYCEGSGFGFGYDHLTDDYKILALHLHNYSLQLHIYSLNNDSWKFKKFTSPSARNRYSSKAAAFVKGELYWRIQCYDDLIAEKNIIVRYDLIDEKIRVIQLPDNIGMTNDSFDLRDFGGTLSMIHYHSVDCITDIWALEEDKWIKLMSIPHPEEVRCGREVPAVRGYHEYYNPVCLTKDGQVLMKFYSFNTFFVFSQEQKKFRKFEIGDFDIRYVQFHPGIIYTETLVSPSLGRIRP